MLTQSKSGKAKATYLPVVNPPQFFGIVESTVYRSNKFNSSGAFQFVKKLQLKTVVYLSPEELSVSQTQFFKENSIQVIHLGKNPWKSTPWKPISEDMVKETLELILDSRKNPILIMCSTGIHITGAVIGCLRRLQHWSLTSIIDKYRNHAGVIRTRFAYEQFIELFDIDLVTLPRHLPEWFLLYQRMLQEEQEQSYSDPLGPLISPGVSFSIKKSIVDDDED